MVTKTKTIPIQKSRSSVSQYGSSICRWKRSDVSLANKRRSIVEMARSLWPSTDSVRPASTEHLADWIRVEGVRSRENWKCTRQKHKAILTLRDLAYQDWRMFVIQFGRSDPGKNPIQTTRRQCVGRHTYNASADTSAKTRKTLVHRLITTNILPGTVIYPD